MSEDKKVKKVARKEDVWHLVQKGMLTTLHFDLETYGLDRDFAQLASYGDALGDISGNLVGTEEYYAKRPDRYLSSATALAVTRTPPSELDEEDRDSHSTVMGKIAQRFEKATDALYDLDLEERTIDYTTIRVTGSDQHKKNFKETILEYPLLNEDGDTVCDVRFHPDKNKIAYRVEDDPAQPYYENIENGYYIDKEDGSKWKFVSPRVLVSGYRIKWADIPWLKANLAKAGFHPSNMFFTHSRSTLTNKQIQKNFAVDTYSAVSAAATLGPQDEDGIKLSDRIDPKTGEKVSSATLSRVMAANTKYASDARGTMGGVTMGDGSLYDEKRAHRSPAYDSEAAFVLYSHMRDIAPDVIKACEQQADEQFLRRELPGLDPTNPMPPIYALPRGDYPFAPAVDPVGFLGFDDQLGKLNKALMIRLDKDLNTFTYRGKSLKDMDIGEIALMMKEQRRSPETLIRAESVRRWGGALPLTESMGAKGAENWDMETILGSFQYLVENEDVCHKIRSALQMVNLETKNMVEPVNAMMEEQWTRNGFGDLDFWGNVAKEEHNRLARLKQLPSKGEISSVVEYIHEKATDIYKHHNSLDEILHRLALQPHPIDYSLDDEAVENYKDLLKRARAKLKKKSPSYARMVGCLPKDPSAETIRNFRWKLRQKFLDHDEAQRNDDASEYREGIYDNTASRRLLLANLSRDFKVIDKAGHEITLDVIKRQYASDPKYVQDLFEKGSWKIEFYRLSSEPSITATLFKYADEGRLAELDDVWQDRYNDLKLYYLYGPPNELAEDHRWMTIPRIEHEIKQIEANMQMLERDGFGQDTGAARNFSLAALGQADIFLHSDEAQRIVAEYKDYIEEMKADNPLTEDYLQHMRHDPETGLPFDRIENPIPHDNFIVIDVPEAHLREPLENKDFSPYSLMVSKLSIMKRKALRDGAEVVFRGAETGRLYYGGAVEIKNSPSENGNYRYLFEQATNAYEDGAGIALPTVRKREMLVIQKLEPVANSRMDVDMSMQAVKVPSLFFDGLTCPRLAYMNDENPISGLVLPVDYCPQKFEENAPIRFREVDLAQAAVLREEDGCETGHTYESDNVKSVKRMKVQDLYEAATSGEISDDKARSYGYPSAFEMWQKVNQAFVDTESQNPGQEEIYVFDFEQVEPDSWAYFIGSRAPEAAFTYNEDGTTPPSAYSAPSEQRAVNDNAHDDKKAAAKSARASVSRRNKPKP